MRLYEKPRCFIVISGIICYSTPTVILACSIGVLCFNLLGMYSLDSAGGSHFRFTTFIANSLLAHLDQFLSVQQISAVLANIVMFLEISCISVAVLRKTSSFCISAIGTFLLVLLSIF